MTNDYQAFRMKLNPGQQQEYKKRHDEIWPELSKLLKDAGISDYHIYLDDQTHCLFAFYKLSKENKIDSLSQQALMKKWWAFMADIMETLPSNQPVTHDLKLMFQMD